MKTYRPNNALHELIEVGDHQAAPLTIRLTQSAIDEADRVGAAVSDPATGCRESAESLVRRSLGTTEPMMLALNYVRAVRAHLGITDDRAYTLEVVEEPNAVGEPVTCADTADGKTATVTVRRVGDVVTVLDAKVEDAVSLDEFKRLLEPSINTLPPLSGAEWTADTKRTAALEAQITALRRENEGLLRLLRKIDWTAYRDGAWRCVWCGSPGCYANTSEGKCADRRRAEELTR